MYFSLDTNLLLFALIEGSRLHNSINNLIDENLDDTLIVSKKSYDEIKKVCGEKILRASYYFWRFIPNLTKIKDVHSPEFNENLLKTNKKLKSQYPEYRDFFDLIYKGIDKDYKSNVHSLRLEDFIHELPIAFLNDLDKKMDKLKRNWRIVSYGENYAFGIKCYKALLDIKFKDDFDRLILVDILSNIKNINPFTFYTNDKRFWKECKKGKKYLIEQGIIDKNIKLDFIYINNNGEFINK
ncbi:hypothetical protein [Candidatus Pyrohabitans sp.]